MLLVARNASLGPHYYVRIPGRIETRTVHCSVVYGRGRGAAAPFNPKKQSALARRLLWAILTSIINPDDTLCRSTRVVNYQEYFRIVLTAEECPRAHARNTRT